MKKILVLYNIKAGHGKIDRRITEIRSVFEQHGDRTEVQLIEFGKNPFDGVEAPDVAVVCGGDGTVNYVVNSMKARGLDIPLGIIPAGTANDFAGAIGMKRDPVKAALQIADGEVERLDCGKVNDLYFINIFSFGLFTTTSEHTPDAIKHRIGKFAYLIEGSKELLNFETIPLHITYDGQTVDVRGLVMLVFNGETAGRFRLARRASVKDGIFDCILMRKCNPIGGAYAMIKYLITGKENFAIKYFRTSCIEMTSTSSPSTDVDGQPAVEFPVKVECIAGGVAVVCPK